MNAADRFCWFCLHLGVSQGWAGTEETPGDSAEITCWRGHFATDPMDSRESLRRCISTAKTCPDFELTAEIRKLEEGL